MQYAELVTYTREIRPVKTDLLVIIASFRDYDLTLKHLELLSKQTFRKFNVLLVAGVPFDDARLERQLQKKRMGFGVIIAKENERRGCSGSGGAPCIESSLGTASPAPPSAAQRPDAGLVPRRPSGRFQTRLQRVCVMGASALTHTSLVVRILVALPTLREAGGD